MITVHHNEHNNIIVVESVLRAIIDNFFKYFYNRQFFLSTHHGKISAIL